MQAEVDIHYFSLDAEEGRLRELADLLSPEERNRAARFRFDRDRARSIEDRLDQRGIGAQVDLRRTDRLRRGDQAVFFSRYWVPARAQTSASMAVVRAAAKLASRVNMYNANTAPAAARSAHSCLEKLRSPFATLAATNRKLMIVMASIVQLP